MTTIGPETWPDSWGPAPRWATPRSPERPTFGPAVARIAEKIGGPLTPAQRYVFDVALECWPGTDELVYDEVIDLEQRRAGKTYKQRPLVAWRCGRGRSSAWITAQKREKAVARWRDVTDALLATPLRSQIHRKISNAHEVMIWKPTLSTFLPFAPNSEDEMHGEDPDLVIVDEQWSFDLAQKRMIEQGYLPAWSVKTGQAWKMSAAGTPRSEWLNLDRRRGRRAVEEGRRSGIAFFEWGAPEVVGGVPVLELPDDDLIRLVIECHPRRDHGLRPGFIANQLEIMGRVDFLRAYGNITQADEDVPGVFEPAVMERARSGDRIPGEARIGLSVAVDEDRREAAIGTCWRNAYGLAVTDEKRADGTRWAASEIIRLVDAYDVGVVAVVNAGPGRNIADELGRAGVPLLRLSQSDHAAASAAFFDEFTAERPSVSWNGKVEFSDAVAAAELKKVPSGIRWESRTGAPVTALDARSLAVWAFDHAPAEKKPRPRFRIS